jgi:hypothetical protein
MSVCADPFGTPHSRIKCPEEGKKRMSKGLKLIVPMVGAGALVTSVFSGALASHPPAAHKFVGNAVKSYTINGRLTVTDVLRVTKNQSVYGRQYAHGGLQVWKGMTVTNGGVTADSLSVKGALSAASATLSGNLQAGTLQAGTMGGSTLALTGAATIGGALNSAGRITGNGLDAGTGGLTTTGNVAGAGFSASSITDSGALSSGSFTTSGSLSAGSAAFGSLQVAGNVNFTNATVTGLNLSGSSLSSLNVGSTSNSALPLNLSSNGKTIAVGVNGNGALTTDSLAVNSGLAVGGNATFAGNLVLGGTGGLTTSLVTAANASGTSTPGPLALTGSTITLSGNVQHNGNTTLGQGKNLIFTTGSGAATHITAGGDTDVAGTLTVSPASNSASASPDIRTAQYNFVVPYTSAPVVVVTAAGNPSQGSLIPAVWVTLNVNSSNQYTGFVLHYQTSATVANPATVTYNFHVIGS